MSESPRQRPFATTWDVVLPTLLAVIGWGLLLDGWLWTGPSLDRLALIVVGLVLAVPCSLIAITALLAKLAGPSP